MEESVLREKIKRGTVTVDRDTTDEELEQLKQVWYDFDVVRENEDECIVRKCSNCLRYREKRKFLFFRKPCKAYCSEYNLDISNTKPNYYYVCDDWIPAQEVLINFREVKIDDIHYPRIPLL